MPPETNKNPVDIFDNISPLDYRYKGPDAYLLTENGFIEAKLLVETVLALALFEGKLIKKEEIWEEIEKACKEVTATEVYAEEDRIKHDIRALANMIRDKVSDEAKPFVHMTATSFDISDTANALRYKKFVIQQLIPHLKDLEKVLIDLALREADTLQVGRTHGQHAVPITFGFAIANHVSRLGYCIVSLTDLSDKIVGKFSGAVGAYNASSVFYDDPEGLELEIMENMSVDLLPAEISTQIVPPESLLRLFCEVVMTAGVMADLADDMRHLQRTEIGEVGEPFGKNQVGSSTMPQKRNPINFENVKSMWKILMPRLMTLFMDQLSEHQRDLTNSASGRTYGEILGYNINMAKRLTKVMGKLEVDHENLQKNLALTKGSILAEPLYIILASLGHPDAHEKVLELTLKSQTEKIPIQQLIMSDEKLFPYTKRMTNRQRGILSDPAKYTGIAADKARKVANHWLKKLELD